MQRILRALTPGISRAEYCVRLHAVAEQLTEVSIMTLLKIVQDPISAHFDTA